MIDTLTHVPDLVTDLRNFTTTRRDRKYSDRERGICTRVTAEAGD
jgi:hypothetical protein